MFCSLCPASRFNVKFLWVGGDRKFKFHPLDWNTVCHLVFTYLKHTYKKISGCWKLSESLTSVAYKRESKLVGRNYLLCFFLKVRYSKGIKLWHNVWWLGYQGDVSRSVFDCWERIRMLLCLVWWVLEVSMGLAIRIWDLFIVFTTRRWKGWIY